MNDLVVSVPSGGLREALGTLSGVRLMTWDFEEPAPWPNFDIVVPPYMGGGAGLRQLEGLDVRLVQWQSIGVDGVSEHLPEGMPLANATTVHETSTAELALALTLAAQRGIPEFVRDAGEGRWQPRSLQSLADRRVLLVGYGGLAKAIESRIAPFEVSLSRIARTAREEQNLAGDTVRVFGLDALPGLLAAAEIVIVAVALTPETRALIGADELKVMSPGALLVNVSRGPVVDTDALVQALEQGHIRAALDVTDPEPLPADHPLWGCPNLLISPHVGGNSSAMLPRMAALLRRQIEHLRAGERPENLVFGEWE